MHLAKELAFAQQTVASASEFLYNGFHAPKELLIETKSDDTFVTDLDQAVSDVVAGACHKRWALLSEEKGSTAKHGQDNMFVLDPIDGTRDLIEARQNGYNAAACAVSLGLWRGDSVLGVVGLPLLGSPTVIYSATKGDGAWREIAGQRTPLVMDSQPTRGVVLSTDKGTEKAHEVNRTLARMGFTPVGMSGSVFKGCAVADPSLLERYHRPGFVVPQGPIVGFVSLGVHLHDVAAITRIVREAGGTATQPKNIAGKQSWAAANNQEVYELLMEATA
jgi:3'-phosphoadenosine 5'-phosphosulfate (PAPS) 3'-phosphatase